MMSANKQQVSYEISGLMLNTNTREVYLNNQLIDVTGLEFSLLHLLMSLSPQIVTREFIANEIFQCSLASCNKRISIHLLNIRKKLHEITNKELIKTIRGQGYSLLWY
ncbi:winged helix-turn-helix domain-containing protein [Thalassotalea piscium]